MSKHNKDPIDLGPLAYAVFWICLFGFLSFTYWVERTTK